jgi:hypothetical protein
VGTLGEGGVIVSFEAGEGCIEHFPAGHDDDVDTGGYLAAPEQLTNQAFRTITFDGGSELPGRRDAKTSGGAAVRYYEEGHEAAVNPNALRIGTLELRSPSNPGVLPTAFRTPRAKHP